MRAAGYQTERDSGAIYVKGSLPNRGSYWRSSRLPIGEDWRIPSFAKKAWFVRVEPLNTEASQRLEKLGRVRTTVTFQPKQTCVLPLGSSEEELLANMKSKHRYNIRLAERHGVQVEIIDEQSAQHFDRFWKLLAETADRHTFRTHDRNYYKKMVETLAPQGMVSLAFATFEGKDLATLLLITHEKVATYLHGGSADHHKEVMAPHLLHWRIIQSLKQSGYTLYDLWGTNAVEGADGWEPKANHTSSGTTRFKLGFGGEVVQYPGAFDLVLKPIPYTLYNGIRRIIRRQSQF